jgi:hypothetical protein
VKLIAGNYRYVIQDCFVEIWRKAAVYDEGLFDYSSSQNSPQATNYAYTEQ